MKQILYNKETNSYNDEDLINKYIYYKEERNDSFLYYIFTIKNIDLEFDCPNITFFTNKCYLLYVPKNKENKAFIYDNYDRVNVSPKNELYELSFTEFVNTFRVFVNNSGKLVSELPVKLIQDEQY